jgi:hypothetical protein
MTAMLGLGATRLRVILPPVKLDSFLLKNFIRSLLLLTYFLFLDPGNTEIVFTLLWIALGAARKADLTIGGFYSYLG